jgi:hypothetical protein
MAGRCTTGSPAKPSPPALTRVPLSTRRCRRGCNVVGNPRSQPIEHSLRLLDAVTGPDGVTKQASSFSRRDAVIDLAARSAIHATTGVDAAMLVEVLVGRLLRDDRVIPVLAPAART